MNPVLKRNNVTTIGQGTKTMVFAHGFGCDQNMWRFVTPAFAAEWRIVLFDYVGAGKSDLSAYSRTRYSSLNGYAQDLIDVCEALDLDEVVFVGHSVSSMVGAMASIQRPNLFRHLIMVGPSPRYINDPPDYIGGFERQDIQGLLDMMEKNYMGWANFLAPMIMKNDDHPEFSSMLEESFCSTDPTTARQFAEVTFFSDSRADLPKVTVPSLILQCSDDIIAPEAVGRYLHAHLPKASFHQLRATGHCPHVSHPEETIASIQSYLRDH